MYTFIYTYRFILVISVVLLAAAFLRFFQLGIIPHGLTWDEAAIGYNGHAIITTRRDEWLNKLPISFRSFGDYKAPLAIYLNGISTAIFGLNAFGVRYPFALAGVVFVLAIGLLSNILFEYSIHRRKIVILGMILAAFSPWHLHYSRVGFEAGLSLSMITLALALFLYAEQLIIKNQRPKIMIALFIGAAILFVSSIYTYHSAKITVPLLVLYLAIRYWKLVFGKFILFLLLGLFSLGALSPLIQDSVTGSGATRAGVLLTAQGLPVSELLFTVAKNYVLHFSPDFLLFGAVDSPRHGVGKWGVLSLVTYALVILGVWSLVQRKSDQYTQRNQIIFVSLVLLLTGILPAALAAETVPHTNRSLASLTGFIILALVGQEYLLAQLSKSSVQLWGRIIFGTVLIIETFQFINFWQYYQSTFPKVNAAAFQDGYIEAFSLAQEYEKGANGRPEVDTILVSNEYGQPYIYALFVRKSSPIAYQGGTLYKYQFVDSINQSDLERKNTLVVSTQSNQMPIETADHVVRGSDGEIRFLLYYTGR